MLAVLERWLPYTVTIIDRFNCIVIEHLIPSLLSISITSPSNRLCNYVTVHCSHKCICIHVLTHITHHTHIRIHMKLRTSPPTLCNADVLLILVPFLQDDSGWPLVVSSLANNKQLELLTLDGCDAFLTNMGIALAKNTSVRTLRLISESL